MYKGHGLHSVHQVVGGQCVKSKSATLLATAEIQKGGGGLLKPFSFKRQALMKDKKET